MKDMNNQILPITDINFHIHFQHRNKSHHTNRPRLDDIMSEYKKLNKLNRIKQEREKEARRLSVP